MNTPFLHIPDGETVTLTLRFANGLDRSGQFGRYYVYGVLHDGKEKLLKVTERLEKQFRKANVQAGQTITLRKDPVTSDAGEPISLLNLVVEHPEPPPINNQHSTNSECDLLAKALEDAHSICRTATPQELPTLVVAMGLFIVRNVAKSVSVPEGRKVRAGRTVGRRRVADKHPVKNPEPDVPPF